MTIKRLIALIIMVALLLSGCDSKAPKAPEFYVEPTKLTESEQELIDFIGVDEDIVLFSYAIDNTVKTITIDTLTLNEQKQWESIGGVASGNGIGDAKTIKGRIMISPNRDGSIEFAKSHENGKTSWSSAPGLLDSLSGEGSKLTDRQEDTIEIVYDQPIPLMMFARSTKNTIRSFPLSEYQNTSQLDDYDAVSVVTICFSQKESS